MTGCLYFNVYRLLDDDLQNELPTPYCTLLDHTLPVTDIVCGVGLFPTCRVLTSSLDHSVKVSTPVLMRTMLKLMALPVALGSFLPLPINNISISTANIMYNMGRH